jgi:predicted glutamine amidotransferase
MCRFLCYKGRNILLSELLYEPRNSLINQSYHAQERSEPLNGDGFGVGWYAPEIGPLPCPFTSVTPAWSNSNLRNLADHVKSPCFFAHVRAATLGMAVSSVNCHPFHYGRYLWMHNGSVTGFSRIKRTLCQFLPDPIYLKVEGTTDSEHSFAVFLTLLGDTGQPVSTRQLGENLVKTVMKLEGFRTDAGVQEPATCNFAVTDGDSIAAIRYVSDGERPESLYYSAGSRYDCRDGVCTMVPAPKEEQSVIVASERLTPFRKDWAEVPPNHLVTVSPDLDVRLEKVV